MLHTIATKTLDSSWEQRKNNPSSSAFILPLLVSRIFASPNSSACKFFCPLFVVVVKLSLGGIAAGRAKGDQVLSEGQAAHHRSGGEHERLCLSVMQGYCLMLTDPLRGEPHCTQTDHCTLARIQLCDQPLSSQLSTVRIDTKYINKSI